MSDSNEAICDKCGQPVPHNNDATFVDAIVYRNGATILFNHPRHFLPTGSCEGSPSRAQYIQGQPRDTRGYQYDPKLEARYRAAYAEVQRRYP